ncbi:MAG: hypothetical protein COB30_004060 [Ectothiorhodospiraceae bacterium]|nr:hypothetical protein [Ectothiorhodospiraceae bacterium]
MSRNGHKNIGSICLITASLALPFTVTAGEIGDIQWHGFLTSSAMVSTDGTYTGDVTNQGGAKDTRVGLTLSTQVDESLDFAAQFQGSGKDDFVMKMDWAFANYDVSENLSLRFGKIKYPVGLYNEYIDVGYTYPWIRPPEGFYNQDIIGPNLTRVAYNGFGAQFTTYSGDNEIGVNVFGGVVDVDDGHVNQLIGTKITFNMEDAFRIELVANTGIMEIEPDSPRFMMMDGERHTTYTAGFIVDMTNFMMASEFGSATMGLDMMDMTSGYVMMGYRFGDYMPHITWEQWDVKGGWGQEVLGVGIRKELTTNSALKFEVRQITPEQVQKPGFNAMGMPMMGTGGFGLFSDTPTDKDITIVGMAIEMVF